MSGWPPQTWTPYTDHPRGPDTPSPILTCTQRPFSPLKRRPPNVMLRKGTGGAWEVRLVDLDWAGVVGRARYPPHMSKDIGWHPAARPGVLLQQEHDVHLLERLF